MVQMSTFGDRPHDEGQVVDGAGRIGEAVWRRGEAGGVGHRRALDRGLGAVEEGVEHLGVQSAALGLLLVEAPVFPDGFRRRLSEMRQPLVAAASRRDVEARSARPVDQFADQRRLVAIGQAVDHARRGGALGQHRAAQSIRLDGDHDHMLAVAESFQRMLGGSDRIAGRLDDDLDVGLADQGLPIVGEMRVAVAARVVEGGRGGDFGLPAEPRQILPRARRREVGDADQMDARRGRDLRQVHRAELAGADQADAQRIARRGALQKHAMKVHERSPYSAAWRCAARVTQSTSQASIGVKS